MDLATRQILDAQQAWSDCVWEAYRAREAAGMFGRWVDGRDWLATQPKLPPARLEQLEWTQSEFRKSGGRTTPTSLAGSHKPVPTREKPVSLAGRRRRRKPPVIAPDRQLEIAIAAAEKAEQRKAADAAKKGEAA